MESALDAQTVKALLEWQMELGVTEAICDTPVDRFSLQSSQPSAPATAPPASPAAQPAALAGVRDESDPVAEARAAAKSASTLEALQAAMAGFEHCDLRRGARNLVFADGNPQAQVMIIGEAPGRDEDQEGRPFVGRAGQLLDRMLEAIDMGRTAENAGQAVYITNILPWRPPRNRDPRPDEIAMMVPFVERHVELVDPKVLVLMGNISCQALLGRRGITRLRGTWAQVLGKPALPMFHPAYLLRQPAAKRQAWADLLDLKARLRGEQ